MRTLERPPAASQLQSSPRESLPAPVFLAWRRELTQEGGEAAGFDWLLEAVGGISRAHLQTLLFHPDSTVELQCHREEVARLWRQHLTNSVPLQYLAGRCWWRTFELAVGPAVLIPRPETETMIDLARHLLQQGAFCPGHPQLPMPDFCWADLGTGSGCLALGLALAFPGSHGLAVDSSPEALEVARHNVAMAGLEKRIHLEKGDWFEAVSPWWGRLHLVLANPPYIPSGELRRLEPVVRDHEPHLALDGGHDGLEAFRRLARQAPRALAPGGWLLLEHHHDQSRQVLELFAEAGLVEGRAHADLEGRFRFVSVRHP